MTQYAIIRQRMAGYCVSLLSELPNEGTARDTAFLFYIVVYKYSKSDMVMKPEFMKPKLSLNSEAEQMLKPKL